MRRTTKVTIIALLMLAAAFPAVSQAHTLTIQQAAATAVSASKPFATARFGQVFGAFGIPQCPHTGSCWSYWYGLGSEFNQTNDHTIWTTATHWATVAYQTGCYFMKYRMPVRLGADGVPFVNWNEITMTQDVTQQASC